MIGWSVKVLVFGALETRPKVFMAMNICIAQISSRARKSENTVGILGCWQMLDVENPGSVQLWQVD